MQICSWNINSVRVRIEQLSDFLVKFNPDIMLLQEIKCSTEVFPYSYFEDLGYNCAVFGQKTYNGVAILSKYRIEDIITGKDVFIDDPQARYIEAFINGYTIASVYVPNGKAPETESYYYKMDFLNKLTDFVECKEKFIIGGDFNITLTDEDVYNPKLWKDKICCTKLERATLSDLINRCEFTDCLELAKSENKTIYTWWDYRHSSFASDHGLRLDYIFCTKDINVISSNVQKNTRALERPSDHAPITIYITDEII